MSEFRFTHPGYVPVLDEIFDVALAECSPAEFKVLAAIVRKTLGYRKFADKISYSQLMWMTHLSKRAVMLAVKALEANNWIVKVKWSGVNWYMIRLDEKMVYSVSMQNFRGKLSIPPWYTQYTRKAQKEVYSVYTQETDLETSIETAYASQIEEKDTRSHSLKVIMRWRDLWGIDYVRKHLPKDTDLKLEPDAILYLNSIGLDAHGKPLVKEDRAAYIAAE